MARKSTTKRRVAKTAAKKTDVELHRIAHYAFFAGLMIAILAGLFQNALGSLFGDSFVATQLVVTTLAILGFIVGLFNLTAKETVPFLLAAIALMLAGIVNFGLIPGVGVYLRNILSNIVVFVVPGALIVGMKTIWQLASD